MPTTKYNFWKDWLILYGIGMVHGVSMMYWMQSGIHGTQAGASFKLIILYQRLDSYMLEWQKYNYTYKSTKNLRHIVESTSSKWEQVGSKYLRIVEIALRNYLLDHHMLLLEPCMRWQSLNPFKFESPWLESRVFIKNMEEWWLECGMEGRPIYWAKNCTMSHIGQLKPHRPIITFWVLSTHFQLFLS